MRDSTSDVCPHCGRPLTKERDTATVLRDWCRANNHHVFPDGSVHEHVAALILDRSPGTLCNWRSNGGGAVPFIKASRTGRVRYRINDLATYIDGSTIAND